METNTHKENKQSAGCNITARNASIKKNKEQFQKTPRDHATVAVGPDAGVRRIPGAQLGGWALGARAPPSFHLLA